jgi:xanthine phosphoribosyltransferase
MSEERYSKDFPVSWLELHRDAKALAWKLLKDKNGQPIQWKGIIAITRGGMVPACIMARELEVLTIETFCINSYDVKNQSGTNILKKPETVTDGGKGWLVIDDLVDTGKTFELAREYYPKAHYACLYIKPVGQAQTDTYVTALSQDTWIHFPWDLENQYATPIARQGSDPK